MAEQQQRGYVSTDPNFGEPITERGGGYVSTDPNFGEPVKVQGRTWADRAGMNEPTDSMLTGFLRGAGAGALDLVQGAVSNVTGQMNTKLDAENQTRLEAGLPETATAPRVEQPAGFSGAVGSALPVVGEMAIGGAPAARQMINAIPSATRAGANFEKVAAAANDIVVDVGPMGDRALRMYELAEKTGYLPRPVGKFLQWATSPKKAPLTYKDSREFASAMSRLSAAERSALPPVMKREVAQMAAELNLANANAAKAAGRGAEYKSAMREYAQAMAIKKAIDATMKHSKKAALGAAGLGGAYYLFKD